MEGSSVVVLAAVEGGGTSFVVTIAELLPNKDNNANANTTIPHTQFKILHQDTILTTSPTETLKHTCDFFQSHMPKKGYYDSLGICTFGPVGVNEKDTQTYGRILPGSPKKEWRNVNILSPVLTACSSADGKRVPAYKVETDVNAPAMAEYEYNTKILHKPITSLAYITVGTGIGVGLVVNDKPVHGMMHPEGGHVPIVPVSSTDDFAYSWGDKSPFGGCLTVEGTASSVALTERLNLILEKKGQISESSQEREVLKELDDDHELWDHAANALANLCVTLSLVTSVEKIVLGGGVMNRKVLYDKIRSKTMELLNGYLDLSQVNTDEGLKDYIGPSIWCEEGAGLVGALALAQIALEEMEKKAVKKVGRNTNRGGTLFQNLIVYSGIFALGVLIGSRNKKS